MLEKVKKYGQPICSVKSDSLVTRGYFCLKERKTPDKTLENLAICKNVCPFGNVYVVKLLGKVLNLECS